MSRRPWFSRKSSSGQKSSARGASKKQSRRFGQSGLERLEDRQMMSGNAPEAFIQQGTLYVYGTQQADNIEVRFANNQIEIPGVMIKNAAGKLVSRVDRSEVPYQVIATGQAGNDRMAVVETAGNKALPVVFYGNQGNDTLVGGSSDDALVGMDDRDAIFGNAGNDKLIAALWADERDPMQLDTYEYLNGGDGNDTIYGANGPDWIDAGLGDDVIEALAGNDRMYGQGGIDSYDGGAGYDAIIENKLYDTTVTNDRLSITRRSDNGWFWYQASVPMWGVERVEFTAASEANGVTLDASGFSGDSWLMGSRGADVLLGGTGNDTLQGFEGDDRLTGGKGQNDIDGGAGSDTLVEQMNLSDAKLSDTVYSTYGVNSTLRLVENAALTEDPATILATPSRGGDIVFHFPGGGTVVVHRPINQFPTAAPMKLDAQAFTGNVNVRTRQGTDKTQEYFDKGKLLANPNSAQWAIAVKYKQMGGAGGGLGNPVTGELLTSDGQGRVRHYQGGSIYWSPTTGAHLIYGAIRDKYFEMGFDRGGLGLPISDEYTGPGRWRVVNFQNGTIYFHTESGVHLSFNRGEMVRYITKLGENGVTAQELIDLRSLVSNPNVFLSDDVRFLAKQIAFTNISNNVFGNPMEWYVSKYFHGGIHPDVHPGSLENWPNLVYQKFNQPLYGPSGMPQVTDIEQGAMGDCYFLAAVMNVLLTSPQTIKNMIADNGDGTFTVRFYLNGQTQYVTVDRYLPTLNNKLYFASAGESSMLPTAGFGLWVALLEKAYAQLNERIPGRDGLYAYSGILNKSGIDFGLSDEAMTHITGKATSYEWIGAKGWQRRLMDLVEQGKTITFHTKDGTPADDRVVPQHFYVMWAVGSRGDSFSLYNPWGTDAKGGSASTDFNVRQLMADFDYFTWTV